ncbi:MAG: hypothetical protein ACW98J_02525 [Candidatus Thorarchaeota archaeon]|jgi:hypothetical protein
MTLFKACLTGDEPGAVSFVNEMVSKSQPSAIWAILMHAAGWNEQRDFDTPHSTIMTHSIHRMIQELGPNLDVLAVKPPAPKLKTPKDLVEPLQMALLERLALHLAAIDHWIKDRGPRYNVDTRLDSLDMTMRNYTQSIRKQAHMGALSYALRLGSRDDPVRLRRTTVSLAAEDPDNLGHSFIMPLSLIMELPQSSYKLPYQATLWHLTEYLVRKAPRKQPDGFKVDDQMDKMATPTGLSKHKNLIATSIVEYGVLGHNGIFAQRIAAAAETGLVHSHTVDWLLDRLEQNIGTKPLTAEELSADRLIKKKSGTDWDQLPSGVDLPNSGKVRLWLVKNATDYWDKMMELKSDVFERIIPDIPKKDWPIVRAAQYAMSALNGAPRASHVIIFTQAVWSLAEQGLIDNSLAALQVHKMLKQYLKGR